MFNAHSSQASALEALQLHPPARLLPLLLGPDVAQSQALLERLERGIASLGVQVRRLDLPAQLPLAARADGSVWIWQGELEACAVLLQGSATQPVLALQATPSSLVQAYNAVKVLWQVAELLPLVLCIEPLGASAADATALARVQRTLLRQAQERLGVQPRVWTLGYDRSQSQTAAAAESSCMRKVLETALVLPVCESRPHADLPVADPLGAFTAVALRGVPDVYRQRHA